MQEAGSLWERRLPKAEELLWPGYPGWLWGEHYIASKPMNSLVSTGVAMSSSLYLQEGTDLLRQL